MKKIRTLLFWLCFITLSGCTHSEQSIYTKDLFPLKGIEYVEITDCKNTLLTVHLEYDKYRNEISKIYSEMEKINDVDEENINTEQCYIVKFATKNDVHEFSVSEDTNELYETVKETYQLYLEDM